MSGINPRRKPRMSYYEPDDSDSDEYIYCDDCGDYVYEYCAIHGPLLVIPDDKVPEKGTYPSVVPRAALTVPRVFLHLAVSDIPDAEIGVFTTLPLPRGVRFGPYIGEAIKHSNSGYCWQIYDANRRPVHMIDAADPERSNWLRYVNCARHYGEQNLVAYQYQGKLYYRTIKPIPRFTELLVFYGSEFANSLGVSLKLYNKPGILYINTPGATIPKRPKLDEIQPPPAASDDKNLVQDSATKTSNPAAKHEDSLNVDNNEKTVQDKNEGQENITETNKLASSQKITTQNTAVTKSVDKTSCDTAIQPNCLKNSSINTTGATLTCDICEYTTSTVTTLNSHLKTHAVTKRYSCDFCLYITTYLHELRRHVRTHTGERPFSCNVCDKKFSRKGNLDRHIRLHTGENPYSCNACDKKFSRIGNLNTHVRVHTGEKPYSCNSCDMKFSRRGNLNRHIRVHTGEKPYFCNVCDKKFSQKGDLDKHLRLHTGEKPYSCNICHMKFSDKGNLGKHSRVHKGE